MSYIEREAIVEEARKLSTHLLNEWDTLGVLALIDRQPSADVVPVRHGRWKLEENWETGYGVYVHVCSACNAITPVNVSRYKYCPNCGAKMDKEVDDVK